jgi:hypothetical protein
VIGRAHGDLLCSSDEHLVAGRDGLPLRGRMKVKGPATSFGVGFGRPVGRWAVSEGGRSVPVGLIRSGLTRIGDSRSLFARGWSLPACRRRVAVVGFGRARVTDVAKRRRQEL